MGTLTKVGVVVLVALVLLSAPIFIQKTAQDTNWKQAWDDARQRAEVAETQAQNQQLAASVWKTYYDEARLSATHLAEQFQTDLADKEAQINRLSQTAAGNTADLAKLLATVESQKKDLEAYNTNNINLERQLQDLRKKNLDVSEQIRRAQDTIREGQTEKDILDKSVKALQEQLAESNRENSELRQRAETGGKTGAVAATVKAPKIEATVTAVKSDLASLNVGSADGVQKGMDFVIYRGATFVAHLRVAEVYASSCAGVIVDAQRDVHQGDKATTVLE